VRAGTITALLSALWTLAALVVVCPVAHAHPLVERGVERYYHADMRAAERSFRQATEASDLTRDDLVQLLLYRALVRFAASDWTSVDADLRALASLDPQRSLPPEAPPPVVERWDRVRRTITEPLSVDVRATAVPEGAVLRAEAHGDVGGLVRAVRIHARVASRAWSTDNGPEAHVAAPSGSRLAYYAEAIGPGGAVVATVGTRATPRTLEVNVSPASGTSEPRVVAVPRDRASSSSILTAGDEQRDEDEGGSSTAWWIVGIGGAVLAAAVVGVAIAINDDPDGATVVGPTWPGAGP